MRWIASLLSLGIGGMVAQAWLAPRAPETTRNFSEAGAPVVTAAVRPAPAGLFSPGPALAAQPRITPLEQVSRTPQAVAVPASRSSTSSLLKPSPMGHAVRASLVLDIQNGLKRAGCYRGVASGTWGADTKRAMGAFLAAANARLPTERPDQFLLNLVMGQEHVVCDSPVTAPARSLARPAAPPQSNPPRKHAVILIEIGGTRAASDDSTRRPAASEARRRAARASGGSIESRRAIDGGEVAGVHIRADLDQR